MWCVCERDRVFIFNRIKNNSEKCLMQILDIIEIIERFIE